MGDAGAGANVRALANADGRNQGGVRADEHSVANGGGVLVHAVVVAGDDARADVYAVADDGIAEIGEMVGLRAAAQSGLLGLTEIADVRLLADAAFGAQMRVGSNHRAVADFRAVEDAPAAEGRPGRGRRRRWRGPAGRQQEAGAAAGRSWSRAAGPFAAGD